MNNYIKFNEDRWNNVKNVYTEPLTHEELEEARNNTISVALTVGKKVPKEWFEKSKREKDTRFSLWWWSAGTSFCCKRL